MTDLGTDISTPNADDLDPLFTLVDGYTGLGQALARRIVTQRGSLLDDSSYGSDIRARVNDNLTPSQLFAIGASVRNEWLQDERVEDCSVTATLSALGALRIEGVVQSSVGPFRLVLAVSSLTVELLTAEAI